MEAGGLHLPSDSSVGLSRPQPPCAACTSSLQRLEGQGQITQGCTYQWGHDGKVVGVCGKEVGRCKQKNCTQEEPRIYTSGALSAQPLLWESYWATAQW